MSTFKLIGLGIAWTLTSIVVAVVTAILLTELLDVIGFVESGEASYTIVINALVLLIFLVVVSVPFVFRKRFIDSESESSGA